MKIVRKGAKADHGVKTVELKPAKMRWNATFDTFDVLFSAAARDFNTSGRHIYKLRYLPSELAAQISMLADAAEGMDAEEFAETFSKVSPALFKLQAMASGLRLAA